MGIPMLKIGRSWDRLIVNMRIPMLVRHLYIETAPRSPFRYQYRLSRYKDSHYNDKTVSRPSYAYNVNFFTDEMASLYWNDSLSRAIRHFIGIAQWLHLNVVTLKRRGHHCANVDMAETEASDEKVDTLTTILSGLSPGRASLLQCLQRPKRVQWRAAWYLSCTLKTRDKWSPF